MKYLKIIFASTLVILAVSGCKKLDLTPADKFTELNFWTTTENVNNALNNIYSGMFNSNLYFYTDDMSDNAYSSSDPIASGSFNPSTATFLNYWSFHYSGIKSCNLFLDFIDQNKTLTSAVLTRMKAEVRFIRAWHYSHLMKWWGDVPFMDHDITPDQAKVIDRTPKATVLKFITDELEACAAVLPTKDQYAASDNGRITKGAAMALEARVLLYQGDRMQDVVTICEKLMNDPTDFGQYSLASSYSGLFSDATINKNNPETILALQYVPGLRTWSEDFDFAPISAGSRTNNLAPTQELVNDYIMLNGKAITASGSGYDQNNPYANRDPRLTATIVYDKYVWLNPDGSTQIIYIKPGSDPDQSNHLNEYSPNGEVTASGYYWRKYFDPNHLSSMSSGLNLQLIRYAEILLDEAEAKNSLGQMDATVWNNTIKLLRVRAGFTDPGALNYPGSTDMVNIIRRERRSEFAMEGLRTDDIRRWKISETVLNGYAHGAQFGSPTVDNGFLRVQSRKFDPSKNYLWPVPQSERDLDPNLSQNNGY